jgi:hypothetical protein
MNVWSYPTISSVQEIHVLHWEANGSSIGRPSTAICCTGFRRQRPQRPLGIEQGDLALGSINAASPITAFYRNTWLRQ